MRAEPRRQMAEFGLAGDPFALGPGAREPPLTTPMPRQGVAAFCKANGPSCTSRDLRRTLATMMIAGGYDMRAAVSCLGHATVSMALNIYADVGPNAKRATVSTEQDCLDVDTVASPIECDLFGNEPDLQPVAPHFHIDQLEAMLTQA